MEKNTNIAIIVACDDHYLVLLAALLKSIEVNHKGSDLIEVFIVEDKVSNASRKKLTQSLDASKMLLHWIPLDDAIPDNLHIPFDRSSYPKNIHTRIFIPYFIPEKYDKIIYLDVDMIVEKDIAELWNIDLGDNLLGAVIDPRLLVFSNSWGGILNYKVLGFSPDTKYFNTGILVIDIEKWRTENCPEKVVQCIKDNEKYANYPDQYGLNIVMANRWLELSPLWNAFASDEYPEPPYLIHFIGRKPMYQTYDSLPKYKERFDFYLNQTAWKGYKPVGETKRYLKKIMNIIEKIPDFFKK